MKIKMIIFGLEDVLCNLDKYHYLAWKQIADELEIPFLEEQGIELLGLSRMDGLNRLLANCPTVISKAEREVLAEEEENIFQGYLMNVTEEDCAADAADVLKTLRKQGYLLAAVSFGRNADAILKRLGLAELVDVVSDGNAGKKGKTQVQRYQYICERTEQKPEDCLVIVGSKKGVKAAKTAGMQVLICEECRRNASCAGRIQKLSELLTYLG